MAEKNQSSPKLFWKSSLPSILKQFIDYRIGMAGALVMGAIVFYINYYDSSELHGAIIAALKQAIYTFLFGGTIMKTCEHLAVGIRIKRLALVAAVVVPSTISIGLTLGVHNLKGTPKPVASTIPTAIFVIPSTFIWAVRKRKEKSKQVVGQANQENS